MGVRDLPLSHLDGQELVVDGTAGRVYAHPSSGMRRAFETSIENQHAQTEALEQVRALDAVTMDGTELRLYVNAGLSADSRPAATAGSSGIGLFRSEVPFMLYDRLPSELEQLQLYREALEAMAPLPVTLRTLDAGGDKKLPYLPEDDSSPALGLRGIRFSLEHPEIFVTQLRAALKANLDLGNLRLLLPMITDLDELERALALIDQAVQQLTDAGFAISRPPIGVMIEVPAAVYEAERLARRVDFLSVGSNDLAQYLLATDRNSPRDSTYLSPAHPALLKALQQVVESTHQAGKTVTICGEIASNPAKALLLLGMGFDALSVSPAALPQVKWAVRGTTLAHMRMLAADALRCARPRDLGDLLDAILLEIGLQGSTSPSGTPPELSAAVMAQ
jgi:phosphotransferase system enzyme I (PtsP)